MILETLKIVQRTTKMIKSNIIKKIAKAFFENVNKISIGNLMNVSAFRDL